MGRLSRHRKIKSCDPFFKGRKDLDISSNVPVKASQLDDQPVPRKAKYLFKDGQKMKLIKGKSGKKQRKLQGKLDVQRRAGESQREYYQRLDKQAADEVTKIIMKDKHVSQKRREFLKSRKERGNKKRQIQEEGEQKEFQTDKVKFGEVVNEPPSFTARPRHADKKTNTTSKVDSLLLQNKLKVNYSHDKEQGKVEILPKSKKRKQMNAFEQQISDRRRLEAIAAYRKIKKGNLEKALEKESA